MEFQLTNPPPKRRKTEFHNTTGTQKLLVSGLDCFPGQLDLFDTDGPNGDEDENKISGQNRYSI